MYPVAESEAKVVYKETLFVDNHQFFMNVSIREAPTEENTASECVRTVAATMAVKFYSGTNTKRMSTDTKRSANDR